jgi:hypothetical protein
MGLDFGAVEQTFKMKLNGKACGIVRRGEVSARRRPRKGLEGCTAPKGPRRPAAGGAGARKRGAPESPVAACGDAPKLYIHLTIMGVKI